MAKSLKTDGPKRKMPTGRRFQKGQTGNPGGRPKTAKFSEAMRDLLKEAGPDGVTNAELLARVALRHALKGSEAHLRFLTERVEGKLTVGLELTGTVTTFQDVSTAALLAKLTELSTLAASDPLHPLSVVTVSTTDAPKLLDSPEVKQNAG